MNLRIRTFSMALVAMSAASQVYALPSDDSENKVFNEKGARGTINGSELITKQEAGKYEGKYMSGSYLRPFTVEFSAGIKF